MSQLIEQRDAAIARVEELKTALGEAITSGNDKARAKASADLAEGQRVVAELNTAIEAVEASEAAAARRADQEEQRRRDAELQANLKAANADLAGLKKKAEAVDAALAAALEAASDLKAAGVAYQTQACRPEYPSLGDGLVAVSNAQPGGSHQGAAIPCRQSSRHELHLHGRTAAQIERGETEGARAFRRCADRATPAGAYQERAGSLRWPGARGKNTPSSPPATAWASLFPPGTVLVVEPGEEISPLDLVMIVFDVSKPGVWAEFGKKIAAEGHDAICKIFLGVYQVGAETFGSFGQLNPPAIMPIPMSAHSVGGQGGFLRGVHGA